MEECERMNAKVRMDGKGIKNVKSKKIWADFGFVCV